MPSISFAASIRANILTKRPLIWVASPALSFAEYALGTGPLVAGVMCLVIALWLFYRSHADLGTNWSITLEVREQHRLITQGVYRRIRLKCETPSALDQRKRRHPATTTQHLRVATAESISCSSRPPRP